VESVTGGFNNARSDRQGTVNLRRRFKRSHLQLGVAGAGRESDDIVGEENERA